MSEFEKKTLLYALNMSYGFIWMGVIVVERWVERWTEAQGGSWNSWTKWIIFFVATVVYLTLSKIFGLWNVPEDGGIREYFRENHLTEREKLLSYKATARTVSAFFLTILLFVVGSILIDGIICDREIELTLDSSHVVLMFIFLFLAFVAIRCFILFIYLRKERLRDCKTQPELQESELRQSEPRQSEPRT